MSGDTLGDLIRRAIELTPMEFSITVNPHRCHHATVEDYLEDLDRELDPKVRAEMIGADRIVEVVAYTNSVACSIVRGAGLEENLRGLISELELESGNRLAAELQREEGDR